MKVLIIRFSSIGDIVLTTPVIRCLKKQLEGIELHYLTKKAFLPVLIANPYIDKLHVLDDNLDTTIEELKAEKFDQVIDLHHNLRTLQVKRALKCKAHSFNKLNVQKWMMTNLKLNILPSIHIVDRYLKTVEHLGVKNDGAGLDYFIPPDEQISQNDIPASHQLGYIAIVVGAAHSTKRLPLDRLKELVQMIDHPIVLLGGKEDRIMGDVLAESDPVKIYNACGKFSLNESAHLVQQSKLLITHDTGLMHIGAAFNKKIITVWGNTIPEFGMYPYFGNAARNAAGMYDSFEVKGLSCRPCSKIGYEKCPKGHFNCMMKIDLGGIKAAAQRMLSAT